jgi:NadR type nicotinamide-nucleotide adenylyltransferase
VISVTVTGSECTGKTTLAAALGERCGTIWVTEYVREFVEGKGAPPEVGDVESIARGQLARQVAAAARVDRLLILDTDLLSTVVYSRHYYGFCPAWVERAAAERLADLYLLAGIDVPWVADGLQRDRGERREEMHELFRAELAARRARVVEVWGPHSARLQTACDAIARLLSGRPK